MRSSNSALQSTVLAYYRLIDDESIDEVLRLFSKDATYRRCESFYNGYAEIERFYREERKIRGRHDIKNLWMEGNIGIVEGIFLGKDSEGEPRQVGFADFFTFDREGKISDRRTYLQLGGAYVK